MKIKLTAVENNEPFGKPRATITIDTDKDKHLDAKGRLKGCTEGSIVVISLISNRVLGVFDNTSDHTEASLEGCGLSTWCGVPTELFIITSISGNDVRDVPRGLDLDAIFNMIPSFLNRKPLKGNTHGKNVK